jgi:hypothetical protein
MPLDLFEIEKFLRTKFVPQSQPDGQIVHELLYFDGGIHWRISVDEVRQFLWLAGDNRFPLESFPTVEMGIFCSNSDTQISIGQGVGEMLTICPKDCTEGANHLCITRKFDGKLSISTILGKLPKDEGCNPPQNYSDIS